MNQREGRHEDAVVCEPEPDLSGWSITDPEARAALARLSRLFDHHDLFFDRRLRPISWARQVILAANRGYAVLAQAHVADHLPPYTAVKVSTVWIGHNLAPPGAAPQVFETMTFAASPSACDTQLDLVVHRSRTEQEARETHQLMIEGLASLMGKPVVVPVKRRGKKADAKLWRGMTARMRREAQRFSPESSGTRRVRGRHGEPDRYVTWTWRPEARLYQVEHQIDPLKVPASRKRRRRGRP